MDVAVTFVKSLPVSGVDTHLTLNLPGRFDFVVELDNWKVMAAWKPTASGPNGLTSLYHYCVRPFTALQSSDDILPASSKSGHSKIVSASEFTPQTVCLIFMCNNIKDRIVKAIGYRIVSTNIRWVRERDSS